MSGADKPSAFDRISVRTVADRGPSPFRVYTQKAVPAALTIFVLTAAVLTFTIATHSEPLTSLLPLSPLILIAIGIPLWIAAAWCERVAIGSLVQINRFDLTPGQIMLCEAPDSLRMIARPIASVRHYETPDGTTVEVALAGDPRLLQFTEDQTAIIVTAAGWSRTRSGTSPLRLLTEDEDSDLRTFVQAVARESLDPITLSERWTSPITPTHISRMATRIGYVQASTKRKGVQSFKINQTGLSYILSEEPGWHRIPPRTVVEQHDSDTLFSATSAEGDEMRSIFVNRDNIEAVKQSEPEYAPQFDQIISLLEEIKLQNEPRSLTSRLGTIISSIGVSSISSAGGTGLVALVRALTSL